MKFSKSRAASKIIRPDLSEVNLADYLEPKANFELTDWGKVRLGAFMPAEVLSWICASRGIPVPPAATANQFIMQLTRFKDKLRSYNKARQNSRGSGESSGLHKWPSCSSC